MLSIQFLQPCEANAHLTTLQNRYTVLKMQTRIMQTSNCSDFLNFREESSVSFWAALIETQNSVFLTFCLQPDDLSPMPRHTVFFEKSRHSKSCCCTRMLKKIGELTGSVVIYFSTSLKVFSATII